MGFPISLPSAAPGEVVVGKSATSAGLRAAGCSFGATEGDVFRFFVRAAGEFQDKFEVTKKYRRQDNCALYIYIKHNERDRVAPLYLTFTHPFRTQKNA